jgi:hypothetical protein
MFFYGILDMIFFYILQNIFVENVKVRLFDVNNIVFL